ncbi:UNVERIFIED_CONTAM: hypothetical protein PYX00_008295 [Menopon gallinae]|uniref:Uncharacterized protein n=1 Tax=Menopon gallinae TaxID=328185 RepID=A0AAW2HMQ6_9NEOP
MKKDERTKVNSIKEKGILRNEHKIQTQKKFAGCDTCKLRNNIPLRRTKTVQDNAVKFKKNLTETEHVKPNKIKLTDLCQEDKKRIVELMEELSKFADKNRSLKQTVDELEVNKKEQDEYILRQANLHLEEKNMYLLEIQKYKSKLQEMEVGMKEKVNAWEARERFMDTEIRCLAKGLQKLFNEKSDLMKEISHLKTCLKHSLESFEQLRNEVVTLQRLSAKSIRATSATSEKEPLPRIEGIEEDFFSVSKTQSADKSSIDLINDKLEHLYKLLQYRAPTSGTEGVVTVTAPVPVPPVNGPAPSEEHRDQKPDLPVQKKSQNVFYETESNQEEADRTVEEPNYKFLKPFNECDKTSVQAERILKKVERPFNINFERQLGKSLDQALGIECQKSSTILSKIITEQHFDEDRILSELFYSDVSFEYGMESEIILAAAQKFVKSDAA